MMPGRIFGSNPAWRTPWSRKSEYTCASQKTSRVATVAASTSPGVWCPAVAAITAVATIVP
jgi:hypothetical protein